MANTVKPMDSTRPRAELRHDGSDATKLIAELYETGRHYPGKRPHDKPYRGQRPELGGDGGGLVRLAQHRKDVEIQRPQDAVDAREKNYDNDVRNGWLRGRGEDASKNPCFDPGMSGNRYGKPSKGDRLTASARNANASPFSAASKTWKD